MSTKQYLIPILIYMEYSIVFWLLNYNTESRAIKIQKRGDKRFVIHKLRSTHIRMLSIFNLIIYKGERP